MQGDDFAVIIVGGGISGLAAGRRLVADGLEGIVVLDAREQPGGKCLQHSVNGHLVDCGPGWTGPTQHDIKNLASTYGIDTYRVEVEGGKLVRVVDGAAEYCEWDEPELSGAAQAELERALADLDRICAGVPGARPWEAEHADELDRMTVEAWIRSQTDDPVVQTALAHRFQSTVSSPGQLSLLSVAAFISSCGGLEELETEADELFVGGSGSIPRGMAEELGDRLRLEWPVSEIRWSSDGVEISGPKGVLTGRRVIVAMSAADARRIHFAPGLTTKRELLHRGWLTGSVIKANVVYDRPFWHEPAGDRPAITGWATNDAGCPSVVLDATPPDGSMGVLVAFSELLGESERFNVSHDVMDDPAARRRVVLENLARMYGPEAEHPVAVHETHWYHERYCSGCLGFAPPGLLTHCGEALREPIGPIHWAGAETADVWINHMSGAVQAGERAALEVVGELAVTG